MADLPPEKLDDEGAYVSGALQLAENNTTIPAPSFIPVANDPQSSTRWSSFEPTARLPPSAYISLPLNQDAVSVPLPSPSGDTFQESPVLSQGSARSRIDNEAASALGTLPSPDDETVGHALLPSPSEHTSQDSISLSSLDILTQALSREWIERLVHEEVPSVPLPESADEISLDDVNEVDNLNDTQRTQIHLSTESPTPDVQDVSNEHEEVDISSARSYTQTIETLFTQLPHLKNVREQARFKSVKVECYDYSDNSLASRESFSYDRQIDDFVTEKQMPLRQLLTNVDSETVQLRLIVAEDLSSELISCLGASLNLSPEIFEEHLLNSGYHARFDDLEADTWITRDMEKTYTTVRWYRPVKRKLQRPYTVGDLAALLKAKAKPFSWVEAVPDDVGKSHGVEHHVTPTTNILRRDWDLKTNTETNVAVGSSAAWEERATIWSKQYGRCRVVLLLLDPLPIVEDRMKGPKIALQRLGFMPDEKKVTRRKNRRTAPDVITPLPPPANFVPKAIVRSRTLVRSRPRTEKGFTILSLANLLFGRGDDTSERPDGETLAVSDRPHANDPESGQKTQKRGSRPNVIIRASPRSGLARFLRRLSGTRSTKPKNEAEEPEVIDEKEGTDLYTLHKLPRCIFEGLVPRGPVVDYDHIMSSENIVQLAEHINSTKSTAACLGEWLEYENHRGTNSLTPLDCLFTITQRDTLNALRLMELSLREIGQHILDDTLIQQRLVHWRHFLERFDAELSQMEGSMRRFAKSVGALDFSNTKDIHVNKGPPVVDGLLKDCVVQIAIVRQRATRSYKSLMANMSIVESKRGIAEAESVTKLTELAFFFIPLTFSASIFSMQVKEINAANLSLSAFFVLAIVITLGAYSLRLLIRSASFIERHKRYMREIRTEAKLPPGASIPTTSFLLWAWHRIGLLTVVVVLLVALLTAPLAVLWTRDMNHGYKALLTVLLLILILGASYIIGNAMLYIDDRGLHFRRPGTKYSIFNPDPRPPRTKDDPHVDLSTDLSKVFSWFSDGWFLLGLVATVIGAGPLAALWTRPLAKGIKVGITIVIGFIYIGCIVAILLHTVQNRMATLSRREVDSDEDND